MRNSLRLRPWKTDKMDKIGFGDGKGILMKCRKLMESYLKTQIINQRRLRMRQAVLIIVVGCMLTACAGWEITPPDKEELVWTSANLVGFHAVQKYPQYAVKAEAIAVKIQGMQDTATVGDTLNPLLLELSLYLGQETDIDPVIVHGLTLLLPLIHVKPGAVAQDKLQLIKSAASGYVAGYNSGKAFARRQAAENEKIALTQPGVE